MHSQPNCSCIRAGHLDSFLPLKTMQMSLVSSVQQGTLEKERVPGTNWCCSRIFQGVQLLQGGDELVDIFECRFISSLPL